MVSNPQLYYQLSLEEFLALPETKPASEYINGNVYQKPMPQGKHSTLQSEIVTTINLIAKPEKLAYAFPELRCTFGGRSVVPDIAIFTWQRIPRDREGIILNKFTIAPDWAIEIVSPEQTYSLLIDKIVFCLRQGCQLGWLIDPEERVILTFDGDRLPDTKRDDDYLPVLPALQAWQIKASDIFNLMSFI